MKAKKIYEIEFTRGEHPYDQLKIGQEEIRIAKKLSEIADELGLEEAGIEDLNKDRAIKSWWVQPFKRDKGRITFFRKYNEDPSGFGMFIIGKNGTDMQPWWRWDTIDKWKQNIGFVNESLEFERGKDPKEAMQIGKAANALKIWSSPYINPKEIIHCLEDPTKPCGVTFNFLDNSGAQRNTTLSYLRNRYPDIIFKGKYYNLRPPNSVKENQNFVRGLDPKRALEIGLPPKMGKGYTVVYRDKKNEWSIEKVINPHTKKWDLVVVSDHYIDYPILYDNGGVSYENPYMIPKNIREKVHKLYHQIRQSNESISFERGNETKEAIGIGNKDVQLTNKIDKVISQLGFQKRPEISVEPYEGVLDIAEWWGPSGEICIFFRIFQNSNYLISVTNKMGTEYELDKDEFFNIKIWHNILSDRPMKWNAESVSFERGKDPKDTLAIGRKSIWKMDGADMASHIMAETRKIVEPLVDKLEQASIDAGYNSFDDYDLQVNSGESDIQMEADKGVERLINLIYIKISDEVEKYPVKEGYINEEGLETYKERLIGNLLTLYVSGGPFLTYRDMIQQDLDPSYLKESLDFKRGIDPKRSMGIGAAHNPIIIERIVYQKWIEGDLEGFIFTPLNSIFILKDLENGRTGKFEGESPYKFKYVGELISPTEGFKEYTLDYLKGKYVQYKDHLYKIPEDLRESIGFKRGIDPKRSMKIGTKKHWWDNMDKGDIFVLENDIPNLGFAAGLVVEVIEVSPEYQYPDNYNLLIKYWEYRSIEDFKRGVATSLTPDRWTWNYEFFKNNFYKISGLDESLDFQRGEDPKTILEIGDASFITKLKNVKKNDKAECITSITYGYPYLSIEFIAYNLREDVEDALLESGIAGYFDLGTAYPYSSGVELIQFKLRDEYKDRFKDIRFAEDYP